MNSRVFITIFLSCFILLGSQSISAQPERPDVVVVIVVDQMRQDYFDSFGKYFTGGLKRLWEDGVVFTNAHHTHGPTNTGPGHAAISTGVYPGQHEIINNSFYDPRIGENVYCVQDNGVSIIGAEDDGNLPGRSPRNLKATTIGDWMKRRIPGSRVFSVSRKDRAAVLMGGQKPDGAYWFEPLTSRFVTSSYYTDAYPDWAREFTGKEQMRSDIERGWLKALPEEAYAGLRPDAYEPEIGLFLTDFPHTIERMRPGLPTSRRLEAMFTVTPMGDRLVMDFARTMMVNEAIGKSGNTDMLVFSCSAADAIGHHFGPWSHEVMDYYIHLDKYLGDFFDYLDTEIGKEKYWIVFSSDHGVCPFPEASAGKGLDAQRIPTDTMLAHVNAIEQEIMAEYSLEFPLIQSLSGGVYLNYVEGDAKRIPRKELRAALAAAIEALPYVEITYTEDDLRSKKDRKPLADLYERSHVRGLSPEIYIQLKENYLVHREAGTSHGSVYEYDTHVPVIFRIPGIDAKKVDRPVSTIDIAPTIAALLEIKADKRVDGEVLKELVAQ